MAAVTAEITLELRAVLKSVSWGKKITGNISDDGKEAAF
jgi:hypothetical protein